MANYKIVRETLSDGSHVFNVTGPAGTGPSFYTLTIGARSYSDAVALVNALNDSSYIEVDLDEQATLAADAAHREWLDQLNQQQQQQAQQAETDAGF